MLTRENLFSVLGVCACLLIWWGTSLAVPEILVPSPWDTLRALLDLLGQQDVWIYVIGATVLRAALSGVLAFVAGISLGLLAGWSDSLRGFLDPIRFALSAIPAPVFVILMLLWAGASDTAIILSVAVMLWPLFFVAARDGMRNVDAKLVGMARVYHMARAAKLQWILWPSVRVAVLPALRISIANALRLTILAEILIAVSGIGERINRARQFLETEDMFALIIILIALIASTEWALSRFLRSGDKM